MKRIKIVLTMLIFALIFLSNSDVNATTVTECTYEDNSGNSIKVNLYDYTKTISVETSYMKNCSEQFSVYGNVEMSYFSFIDYTTENNDVSCSKLGTIYANVPIVPNTDCTIYSSTWRDLNGFSEFKNTKEKKYLNDQVKHCIYSVDDDKLNLEKETFLDVRDEYVGKDYIIISVDTGTKKIVSNNVNQVLGAGKSISITGYYDVMDENDKCLNPISSNTIDNGDESAKWCVYKGMQSGKEMSVSSKKDEIKFSDGTSLKHSISNPTMSPLDYASTFPDFVNCSGYDIFFSKKDGLIISVGNNTFSENAIKQICHDYSDVEQYCYNGNCNFEKPLCGGGNGSSSSDGGDDSGSGVCPSQLRPAIVFVKRVVINTLQIFVPILLILMGIIDMTKATMSTDDKGLKEATARLIRRIITAILFFFITTIVTIFLNQLAKKSDITEASDWKACWRDIG